MNVTIAKADEDFEGLCFTNLVDFDMVYGHRNDIAGYANAMSEFDAQLPTLLEKMREDDILIIPEDIDGYIRYKAPCIEKLYLLCGLNQ
jgi:phosphopentomutase